jgi:hypothetical protein
MSLMEADDLFESDNSDLVIGQGNWSTQPAYQPADPIPDWAMRTKPCPLENEHTEMQYFRCHECGGKANPNVVPEANCADKHAMFRRKHQFIHCPHCEVFLEEDCKIPRQRIHQ